MLIKNKKTGEVKNIKNHELDQYGLGGKLKKAQVGLKVPFTKDSPQNNQYNFGINQSPTTLNLNPTNTNMNWNTGLLQNTNYGNKLPSNYISEGSDEPTMDNYYNPNQQQVQNNNQISDLPIVETPEFNPQLTQSVVDYNNSKNHKTKVYGSPDELSQINTAKQNNSFTFNPNTSFTGFGNPYLAKGVSQLGSGLVNIGKGTLDTIGSQRQNQQEQLRNQKQYTQSVYSNAIDERPDADQFGHGFMGRNSTFKNGGITDYKTAKNGANVLTENKEVAILPNGLSDTMYGDNHSDPSGGIPLNLPEGSKILSEKLKVITPKGKKSYADLGKKFETKKNVDMLEAKNADPIQKSTAELMIKFKKNKLDQIFEQQEQDKLQGLHGIDVQQETLQQLNPQMAANGGYIKKFDVGGVNYKALGNVEEQLGVLKKGMPSSTGYNEKDLHQLDSKMNDRIKSTIGEDVWNSLPYNLRTQVFSFAFNNGVEKKNWLTGLAQALDPSITDKDRGNLTDESATNIIKGKIGSINSDTYTNYINKVLPSQYKSIAVSNNKQEEYKKLWQFRPNNLDEFMKSSSNNNFSTNTPTPVNNLNPITSTGQQPSTYTGTNPNYTRKSLNTINSGDPNFLPYTSADLPESNQYGNKENLGLIFDDFESKTGIKLDESASDAEKLAYIRYNQNQITPGLTKDYKEHYTRGNNDLYEEYKRSKGYKLASKKEEESKQFKNWAKKNNYLLKDYEDKGQYGHEYYKTAKLPFANQEEYDKWKQDPDWQQVGNYYVDRSAYNTSPAYTDENGVFHPAQKPELHPITYYSVDKQWENKPKEQVKTNPTTPIKKTVPQEQLPQVTSFDPNVNIPLALPNIYSRVPENMVLNDPSYVNERYLDIQPQLNEVTRGQRAFQNNLGDRGTASLSNALQSQINAYNQNENIYGNKYNYDKQQDSSVQQFNAQARMNTGQFNTQANINPFLTKISQREANIGDQQLTDQYRGLERMDQQQAYENNKNYIDKTFQHYSNMDSKEYLAEALKGLSYKQPDTTDNEETTITYDKKGNIVSKKVKTKADGGIIKNKLKIKPKIKK